MMKKVKYILSPEKQELENRWKSTLIIDYKERKLISQQMRDLRSKTKDIVPLQEEKKANILERIYVALIRMFLTLFMAIHSIGAFFFARKK